MKKIILFTAAVFGLLSVVFGAFGAHGLKSLISADAIESFETGVRYQMYHAILLLIVGSSSYLKRKNKIAVFYLVLIGIILFSGSIYGLATNELSSFDFKRIAFITPIGGSLLILSWIAVLVEIAKNKF